MRIKGIKKCLNSGGTLLLATLVGFSLLTSGCGDPGEGCSTSEFSIKLVGDVRDNIQNTVDAKSKLCVDTKAQYQADLDKVEQAEENSQVENSCSDIPLSGCSTGDNGAQTCTPPSNDSLRGHKPGFKCTYLAGTNPAVCQDRQNYVISCSPKVSRDPNPDATCAEININQGKISYAGSNDSGDVRNIGRFYYKTPDGTDPSNKFRGSNVQYYLKNFIENENIKTTLMSKCSLVKIEYDTPACALPGQPSNVTIQVKCTDVDSDYTDLYPAPDEVGTTTGGLTASPPKSGQSSPTDKASSTRGSSTKQDSPSGPTGTGKPAAGGAHPTH